MGKTNVHRNTDFYTYIHLVYTAKDVYYPLVLISCSYTDGFTTRVTMVGKSCRERGEERGWLGGGFVRDVCLGGRERVGRVLGRGRRDVGIFRFWV